MNQCSRPLSRRILVRLRPQRQTFHSLSRNNYASRTRYTLPSDYRTSISSSPVSLVRRSSSVFSSWDDKEWHQEDFMHDSSLKQKEAWLENMLRSHGNVCDVKAFLVVLRALASPDVQDAGAPRRAERWMNRLQNQQNLQPTAECYQAAIQAWANSRNENILVVVNRSERWLNDLIAATDASPESIQPTIGCFNAFLDACTRGRPGKNKKNQSIVEKNAIKAEAILRQLHSHYHHFGQETKVIPNTDTFNFVIRGWTRCKHNEIMAQKVLALLRLMEAYQRENPMDHSNVLPKPNTKSYAMTMDALVSVAKLKARRCHKEKRSMKDPAKNGVQDLEEAQAILAYMHDLYDAGVKDVVPHRIPYNILITGWASLAAFGHQDAPFKAEEIMRTMLAQKDKGFIEAAPDRISFEKIMSAWANSKHPNAGKRASWWLKKLLDDSELDGDENLLPSNHTYNIAMKALAASEGAQASENLLLTLGEKYKEANEPTLCPNSESFAIVIRAWLNEAEQAPDDNEHRRSLSRAVEWLTSLREIENEKNLSSSPELFIGVLRSCTKCARLRPSTLDLAKETFHGLKNSRFQFDTIPYCLLLQVGLDALSGPNDRNERLAFVENLFKDCCEDGLVSNMFVQTLARSKTYELGWTKEERTELVEELLPDWPLPKSWSRNLANTKYYPRPSDLHEGNDSSSSRYPSRRRR